MPPVSRFCKEICDLVRDISKKGGLILSIKRIFLSFYQELGTSGKHSGLPRGVEMKPLAGFPCPGGLENVDFCVFLFFIVLLNKGPY